MANTEGTPRCAEDRLQLRTAQERWIPNHRIKTRIHPVEHFRKLDLPVERRERWIGPSPLFEPSSVPRSLFADDRLHVLAAPPLPFCAPFALEESRHHEVADE